eukprot:15438062-Alexandrium_andersonii.AAC.1
MGACAHGLAPPCTHRASGAHVGAASGTRILRLLHELDTCLLVAAWHSDASAQLQVQGHARASSPHGGGLELYRQE